VFWNEKDRSIRASFAEPAWKKIELLASYHKRTQISVFIPGFGVGAFSPYEFEHRTVMAYLSAPMKDILALLEELDVFPFPKTKNGVWFKERIPADQESLLSWWYNQI